MPLNGSNPARIHPLSGVKTFQVQEIDLPLWRAGIGLFLLSAASLAFEVTLTHLYSLVLQYHFAFLAVSMAILGLGIGAAVGYTRQDAGISLKGWMAAVYAIAMPLVVILFSLTGFVPGVVWQAGLGALPYVAVGLLTSRLYTFYGSQAAWLYAFDLVGAAFGLLGIQALLSLVSPASAGFVLGLLAGAAALIFTLPRSPHKAHRINLRLSEVALIVVLAGLALNLTTHFADLPLTAYSDAPADKTMFHVLADPAEGARLVDSAWSSFARVDLVSLANPDQMYAFTNAGAGSYMIRFDGDLSKVKWLEDQLEYLPFSNFKPERTLVLGAGAGKDILQALLAGSKSITAVEINPAMVALTRKYASFNGGILDYPGVTTVVADGREFVERTSDTYNMIYLNLVYAQAPAPGSNALSESYIFTTQAFQAYWQRLAPDGRLAIISHQGLEGSRALLTAIKALNLAGFGTVDALKHTALLMYNGNDPNQNTTVMILQKSLLSPDQVSGLNQDSQKLGMQPLFLPGAYETLLKDLASGTQQLDQYLAAQDYNLFPTSDDRPFFFDLNPGLPQPLVVLLAVAVIAAILYLILMRYTYRWARDKRKRPRRAAGVSLHHNPSVPTVWQIVYFGGLGLGFMLVEVPLIQRTLLLVGSPTTAMVIVLEALLLGGGAGSLLSARWKPQGLWLRLALVGILAATLAVALAIWQPVLVAGLSPLGSNGRAFLAGLMLFPSGFLMGMPFANGLRLAGTREASHEASLGVIPCLWGWNALTSVLGSALAASIGMLFGFNAGLFSGAACYLLIAIAALMQGLKRPH